MSERISQTIILCEDDAHCSLVRSYMKACGLNADEPRCRSIVASRAVHGGNAKWVVSQYPAELTAARARHKAFARTLLIVVADADDLAVVDRSNQFNLQLQVTTDDPLVLLIPRRNIETWMQFAVNPTNAFNETDDYMPRRPLDKSQVRAAGRQIHDWAHDKPKLTYSNVPSLTNSLHLWRRIG